MSADYYYTIERSGSAEFKDRGSRFIAFAFPVSDSTGFKTRLHEIRTEHPKAAHHCFAYRIGTDSNNFRSSDDREPPGSAGKPILGQIDSRQLTNVAVVVIRYFGGTLLGVPGLINAYRAAASMALQTTPLIQKSVEIIYHLEFDYTIMNQVMTLLKKYNCTIRKNHTEMFCLMEIGIPKAVLELVTLKLREIKGLELKETSQ